MKKLFLILLSTLLFVAYANCQTISISPTGVGPVKLGMNIADVPKSVKGLYDHIKVETTPEYYDEMEYETIPAYDTYYFMLDDEKMFHTVPSESGVITYLNVVSKKLSYKGVHPQMSCRDVLKTKAKLMSSGAYASCEFSCYFRFEDPNITIWFPTNNEGAFTQRGEDKLLNANEYSLRELRFDAADFKEETKIETISIQQARLL